MIILIWILGISGSILLLLASIAFFRAKDVFVMLHILTICNFYIVPLILLSAMLERFSWISLTKTLAIIILNIIITYLISYITARRAIINKVIPDADFKKMLKLK